MKSSAALLSVLLLCMWGACGGSDKRVADQPEPAGSEQVADESADADDDDEPEDDEGLEIEGLAGHLDPVDVENAIQPYGGKLSSCYDKGIRRLRFVEGEIEFRFKVGRTGEVKGVYLSRSSLGAWQIELCLLEVARAIQFTRPSGNGDADFRVPLAFHSGRSGAVWWTEEQAEAEVSDYVADLSECGPAPEVLVTLYLGPRGVVKSVGFAGKDKPFSDEWADCAQEMVLGWKLSDPRGRVAKLGFWYNAR